MREATVRGDVAGWFVRTPPLPRPSERTTARTSDETDDDRYKRVPTRTRVVRGYGDSAPRYDTTWPKSIAMRPPTTRTAMVAALLMIGGGWMAPAHAGIVLTTPAGLAPGDQFRFVFVTDGTTTAASTDITTYDTFVQSQAGGATYNGLAVTWLAIGSTSTVNAIDHIGQTDTPVYLVDGTMVTTSTTATGLWSGSLIHAINEDINGLPPPPPNPIFFGTQLWSGTSDTGESNPGFAGPLGNFLVAVGNYEASSGSWINTGGFISNNAQLHIYGISAVLTVVPEPPSILLLGVGGVLKAALGWTRRHRRQRPVVGPADTLP